MNSFKKKFHYLVIVSGLVLCLAYFLSFKKAIHVWLDNQELSDQLSKLNTLDRDIQNLEIKIQKLNTILGTSVENSQSFEEQLLHQLGEYGSKESIKISDFGTPMVASQNGFTVKTVKVKCQSEFSNLLKLLHHLEHKFKIGVVSSSHFYLEKDYKRNKTELYLELYVQQILQQNE